MISRLLALVIAAGALAAIVSCASPTPTAAPTIMPTATAAPTETLTPASANCIKCHTDKATLESLAVAKTEKSTETQGEG
jgi:hypothetical protein